MGLACSLNEAHVGDHRERVGAQPGRMRMMLPLKLMPSPKDKELRSIVPRPFPQVGLGPSATDEQDGVGDKRNGDGFGGYGSDDRDNGGSETESKEGPGSDGVPPSKGLRVAPTVAGGVGENVDHGGGPAAARKAKKRSKDRRRPKRVHGSGGGRDIATVRRKCLGSYCSPLWVTP
jgi:hypothetical protein